MSSSISTVKLANQKPLQDIIERYSPDLESFFSVCDKNYLLVNKLIEAIGGVRLGELTRFGITLNTDLLGIVEVSLEEESRYTSTYVLHQIHPSSQWLPGTCFKVRLYHDARMAEVLQYQQSDPLQPSYTYPNRKMYHSDEKQQHNLLLNEWLLFSLEKGCQLDTIF